MIINIDGRNYSFKFFHKNDQPVSISKLSKKVEQTPLERATTCIIFNEEGVEVSSGVANVHPKDNFNKEKGRQIALARAISDWDKPYRTQVWNEYRTWGAKDRW